MKANKTLSLILVAVLAASALTACGSKSTGDDAINSAGTSAASAEKSSGAQEEYTVKIMMFDDAKTEVVNEVAAAASKITKEKFNTNIELTRIGYGSWAQQVNLALASGEKLDLFPAFLLNSNLPSLVATGQVLELDDLFKSDGKEMYDSVDKDDLKCDSVDGKIYGVPMNKGKRHVVGVDVDKTMADDLGIDTAGIKDLTSLGEALKKVKEAHPEMYPLATNTGKMTVVLPNDPLSDSYDCVLGGLINAFSDDTTVVNIYDTDAYKEYAKTMYDWAQKGYIMPDGSSNTETGDSLIKAGVSFASLYTGPAPDTEARLSRENGKPMADCVLIQPIATTQETAPCWSISATSEKPERAMQILNEMYTNQELENILIYGIEGKQYEFLDKDKKIIDYPKGVDATNSGYNFDHWAWPNMLLSYVWNGFPEDVYKQYEVFNKSGTPSPAYGFTFDNSNVLNEVTACTNVVSKYVNALNCGSLDPEVNLPKFNKDLADAGLDAIIAEKQKQLDSWLAEQK